MPQRSLISTGAVLPKKAALSGSEPVRLEYQLDRGDGHARLSRREAGEMNGERHRLRGCAVSACATSSVRTAIDGEPRDTQRAARLRFGQRRAGDGSARRHRRRAPPALTATARCCRRTRSTSMKRSILSPTSAIIALPAKPRRCAAPRQRVVRLSRSRPRCQGVSAAAPDQPTSNNARLLAVERLDVQRAPSRRGRKTWRARLR